MTEIRKVPAPEGGRVEDGAVQFGDDWPGTFLRGDSSFGYANYLRTVLDGYALMPGGDAIALMGCYGLLDALRESNLTLRPLPSQVNSQEES